MKILNALVWALLLFYITLKQEIQTVELVDSQKCKDGECDGSGHFGSTDMVIRRDSGGG